MPCFSSHFPGMYVFSSPQLSGQFFSAQQQHSFVCIKFSVSYLLVSLQNVQLQKVFLTKRTPLQLYTLKSQQRIHLQVQYQQSHWFACRCPRECHELHCLCCFTNLFRAYVDVDNLIIVKGRTLLQILLCYQSRHNFGPLIYFFSIIQMYLKLFLRSDLRCLYGTNTYK